MSQVINCTCREHVGWSRLWREIKREISELFHRIYSTPMPLFTRRTSFRTPKKPPRRNKSLPNIAQLDDSLNFTTESIKLDVEAHATGETQAGLVMKLGDCALSFEEGKWVVGESTRLIRLHNLTQNCYISRWDRERELKGILQTAETKPEDCRREQCP